MTEENLRLREPVTFERAYNSEWNRVPLRLV